MRHVTRNLASGAAILFVALSAAPAPEHDYPVQPVPFTGVHLRDVFWAPRIETNRVGSIPFACEQCGLWGRVDNCGGAAKARRGEAVSNGELRRAGRARK